jgi:SAM-dependent methyltransferase
MSFRNVYADATRADSYATLEFANTYHVAFRDLPAIFREHVSGNRALDFGCGAGRSTRFVRQLGFETTGVDTAEEMIAKARELDSAGDYRLVPGDDFTGLEPTAYDLITSLFTFDNIPGFDSKLRIFRDLGTLLRSSGTLINVVSSPEIYLHEWASFSTRDFLAQNRLAGSGDEVRIVTTEFPDQRPCVDILCTDEDYRQLVALSGFEIAAIYKPLAKGEEPYQWVSEMTIAPWVIYVLAKQAQP